MSKHAKNIFLLTSDVFTATLYRYVYPGVIVTKNQADESLGKKSEEEREKKKKKRKIAENFTLIAPAVIVLLLSKYISSQTENCIHYQVYFVQHFFFNAATKVCETFRGISKF